VVAIQGISILLNSSKIWTVNYATKNQFGNNITWGFSVFFRSFVRSHSPLAEVEQLLPPLFEAITVVINVNGLWIAKHSDNEQYRQEANRIRKAGFVS
jgi:hypothetical protein